MAVPEHDVSKLPRWAQQRIEQAEATAKWWHDKVAKVEAGDAAIWLRHGMQEDIPLAGANEVIRFALGEQDAIDVSFDPHGPGLRIARAWGGGISVRPHVTNVILVDPTGP